MSVCILGAETPHTFRDMSSSVGGVTTGRIQVPLTLWTWYLISVVSSVLAVSPACILAAHPSKLVSNLQRTALPVRPSNLQTPFFVCPMQMQSHGQDSQERQDKSKWSSECGLPGPMHAFVPEAGRVGRAILVRSRPRQDWQSARSENQLLRTMARSLSLARKSQGRLIGAEKGGASRG